MSFHAYNVKAHNRAAGRVRTLRTNRRNAAILEVLRAAGELPTTLKALRELPGIPHRGLLPNSALLRLARMVRNGRML